MGSEDTNPLGVIRLIWFAGVWCGVCLLCGCGGPIGEEGEDATVARDCVSPGSPFVGAGGLPDCDESPDYVGSRACASCHGAAYAAWMGSHHQRAMLPAASDSVVGDFAESSFVHGGAATHFDQRNGGFWIRTRGAGGVPADFEVRYTFGVEPLQQYLLELPGGRLQAFDVAWNVVDRQWFHLQPDDGIDPGHPLHWTGLAYNWNFMCADCHSTGVRKGYDAIARIYRTEFAEVSVGCEACHGPGSDHLAWAGSLVRPDGRSGRSADPTRSHVDAEMGESRILGLRSAARQIGSCAPCHSRRAQLADGFTPDQPLLDYYLPALLDDGLYEADGQILDEVYVYGSFLQSRMHARGVACGDCHEPHTAGLLAEGNALCVRCHNASGNPLFPALRLADYDTPDHHLHPGAGAGTRCVSCHMPERTYMLVDERSDHGFRIPRPDLTIATGVPNACGHCHDDRTAAWARDVLERRFGAPREAHFAPIFAAARLGKPGIEARLAALGLDRTQPAIVRGTALSLMSAYDDAETALALERGVRDADALARIGAVRGAARFAPGKLWRLGNHLLEDPLRAVRGEAAQRLAIAYADLADGDRNRLQAALDEYLATQRFNADGPQAQTNMALVFMAIGRPDSAESALQTALSTASDWIPALVNLADLYRATGRDDAGGELLERALAVAPEHAEVKLARAFWLVRRGRIAEALPLLRAAVELAPHNSRHAYTYAVALHSAGEFEQALVAIDRALLRLPGDQRLIRLGTGIARESGDTRRLERYRKSAVGRE